MNRPEGISESAWSMAKQITSAEYDSYAHQVIETAAAIQSSVEAERAAIIDRLWESKDLDGSTGDEYDNGYVDAFNDAIRTVRKGA